MKHHVGIFHVAFPTKNSTIHVAVPKNSILVFPASERFQRKKTFRYFLMLWHCSTWKRRIVLSSGTVEAFFHVEILMSELKKYAGAGGREERLANVIFGDIEHGHFGRVVKATAR